MGTKRASRGTLQNHASGSERVKQTKTMSTTTPTVAVDGRGDVENPPAIKTALDKWTRKEGDGDADGTSQKTNLNKKMDKLAKREEKQSFWKLHKEELWTIVAYGALRFGVSFFSELKDNSFVYVSAHASR